MAKKTAPIVRVFEKFKETLEEVGIERVKNGVERKTPSTPELTRMIMNTSDWRRVIKELSIKPRKEDLR